AREVAEKLTSLGYVLCEEPAAGISIATIDRRDRRVEALSEREHERWLRRKLKTGWRYGEPRDDARKLHPSIRPWAELPEEERDKDRAQVVGLPRIVEAAGLSMARLDMGRIGAERS
ncbi:MAG TPA: RyR domain-containing protein, partial [Candidatus Binatus sp.]|nr:RyR domain-containing protein [Candidatus Binatus sp.]